MLRASVRAVLGRSPANNDDVAAALTAFQEPAQQVRAGRSATRQSLAIRRRKLLLLRLDRRLGGVPEILGNNAQVRHFLNTPLRRGTGTFNTPVGAGNLHLL